MKTLVRMVSLGTLLCAASGASICTATRADAAAWTPFVQVHGGGNLYKMDYINSLITSSEITSTGDAMDAIDRGISYGGRVGVGTPDGWSLWLGYDRLVASSERTFYDDGIGNYTLTMDLPGNEAMLGLNVPLGHSTEPTGFQSASLVVGAGAVWTDGELRLSHYRRTLSQAMKGSGPAGRVGLAADWRLDTWLTVTAEAGYEFAKITKVRSSVGGYEYVVNGGSIDYSGPSARLGFRFSL
jgi:hypothetical protein